MKKLLVLTGIALATITTTFAADKEITVKGEGACAKCALHKSDECQNTIKDKDGVIYYLEGDKSTAFHKNVCKGTAEVVATGTVKEVGGKKVMTVAKIDKAEK